MDNIARLTSALRGSREGAPFVVGLRERLETYGVPCTIRAGRARCLVVRAAAPGEGAPGELVAEYQHGSERRVIATEHGVKGDQPSSTTRQDKVRAIRIGDELWEAAVQCAPHDVRTGKPNVSALIRTALAEYFLRRNLR